LADGSLLNAPQQPAPYASQPNPPMNDRGGQQNNQQGNPGTLDFWLLDKLFGKR
jgi:hypothetical protein